MDLVAGELKEISARIVIPQFLRHLTNHIKVVEVKGSTVGECLNDLVRQFPQTEKMLFDNNGRFFGHIEVYINKESAYPEEFAKPVKDSDELDLMVVTAGG